IDLARVRQLVEGRALVEAAHFHGPFHWCARAVEGEAAVLLARDRHHAPIDLGSKRPVDLELRLAGALALRESGIVEERKAHRAFDLVSAPAGEEHRGRMRVDALDLAAAVRGRIAEQHEYPLLAFALGHPHRGSLSSAVLKPARRAILPTLRSCYNSCRTIRRLPCAPTTARGRQPKSWSISSSSTACATRSASRVRATSPRSTRSTTATS